MNLHTCGKNLNGGFFLIDLFSKPEWHKTQCDHGCLEGEKGQARCKVNDADNSYSNHAEYEWKVALDEKQSGKK